MSKGRENEAALRTFTARLNEALKAVELENVETLTHAVGLAKSWIKDVERKHKAAERVG